MSIKPILFNTEMVQANLDGRKNTTRRIMKPQPVDTEYCNHEMVTFNDMLPGYYDGDYTCACRKCGYGVGPSGESVFKPPYVPGDILYVRETWRIQAAHRFEADVRIEFKAGGPMATIQFPGCRSQGTERREYDSFLQKWDCSGWHPSIHMPKEAARLFLRVTNVRVERLQDIDGLGSFDEGSVAEMPLACLPPNKPNGFDGWSQEKKDDHIRTMAVSAYIAKLEFANRLIKAFSKLWDSTIKTADLSLYGWDANPWVWVIEYERCEKPAEVNCNG